MQVRKSSFYPPPPRLAHQAVIAMASQEWRRRSMFRFEPPFQRAVVVVTEVFERE
jgi:hypothetical protein